MEDELIVPVEARDTHQVGHAATGVRALEDGDEVDRLGHEVALRRHVGALC
jgi:hypothetical protein